MVKSAFHQMHHLLSKQNSTLNIERHDLQLKLPRPQPNAQDLLIAHQTYPFQYEITSIDCLIEFMACQP